MKEQMSIGLLLKQINNVYEKDFNNRLRTLGITASQCAVLDYLLTSRKEEVNQRDIEKALCLKNPTVTGLLKRLDEKGFILVVPSTKGQYGGWSTRPLFVCILKTRDLTEIRQKWNLRMMEGA